MTDADRPLTALEDSHARLLDLVDRVGPEGVTTPSYCTEWSVADVLSHLGSGAEIGRLNLEAAIRGEEPPGREAMQPIWDRWNAKDPETKAADAVVSDARMIETAADLDDTQKEAVRFHMGAMELDLGAYLSMRVSEHTLHSWDIAVVLDPDATLPSDDLDLVLPNVERIIRFVGRPTEPYRTIAVHTTAPESDLVLAIGEAGVTLTTGTPDVPADVSLSLPAEAFVRLAYGRLDPDHTPAGVDGEVLDQLRKVFPGV
ncbi:MAG TPA: maleylpyruvate isomerase family mycothiol-dependent enzyme [Acidimicrobiales bacterium]